MVYQNILDIPESERQSFYDLAASQPDELWHDSWLWNREGRMCVLGHAVATKGIDVKEKYRQRDVPLCDMESLFNFGENVCRSIVTCNDQAETHQEALENLFHLFFGDK